MLKGFHQVQTYYGYTYIGTAMDRHGLGLEIYGGISAKTTLAAAAAAAVEVHIYLCQVQGKPLRISISRTGRERGRDGRANLGSAERGAVARSRRTEGEGTFRFARRKASPKKRGKGTLLADIE